MLYLFIEKPSYGLSYLFELEAFLKLSFNLLAKLLLGAFFDVKIVDGFEQIEPNLIDTADDSFRHPLSCLTLT